VSEPHHTSRNAVSPEAAAGMGSSELRENFLVQGLFAPDAVNLTYAHYDRMVVGGAMPVGGELSLAAIRPMGTGSFLERRELAAFNLGGAGTVTVGGEAHKLAHRDMIYVGLGAGEIALGSDDDAEPAKFYLISAPAHRALPTRRVEIGDARRLDMGAAETSNERSIFQFVHPKGIETCQLVVGMTTLATGSVWNTMPAHVHERRSEAYLYFGLAEDARVFHFMGEPAASRHIVVANEEAVLSPHWSIHCGAGTTNYAFIWAMAGDNVDFTDIDPVPVETMR
jgi:4-deoxy-L-threo-5-hexosulose-uronate ketol-isomerase